MPVRQSTAAVGHLVRPILQAAFFCHCLVAVANESYWTNSGAGSWLSATNWTNNLVPTATDRVQINNGGTAQLSAAGACYSILLGSNVLESGSLVVSTGATLNVFLSGSAKSFQVGSYGTGTLYQTGGTINYGQSGAAQNLFALGAWPSGVGNYTIAGGNLNVYSSSGYDAGNGFSVGNSGIGVWNVWGGTVQLRNLAVGKPAGSLGTVNQTNGAVNVGVAIGQTDETRIGGATSADASAVGTYNLSGGTFTNAGNYQVGAYGAGTNNISGGILAVGTWPSIGRFAGGLGVVNVTGGLFIQTGTANSLIVGEGGTGQVNISGSGTVTAQAIVFGNAATGNGTINLDGGTLLTGNLSKSSGSGTFNFNGGTLRFGNSASMASGITSYVKPGGARIDSSAYTVTVYPNLLDAGGGLTKLGTGSLILSGSNSFSGGTVVSAGTLNVSGSLSSGCQVNAGAVLTGTGSVAGNVTVDGSLQPGNPALNAPGTLTLGSLALDTGATLQVRLANTTNSAPIWVDSLAVAQGLTLTSNAVILTPLGTNLVPGVYRLISYAGPKTGSLGAVIHKTRYNLTLDESTTNQINLVVNGGAGTDLSWSGTSSAVWDVAASTNWLNLATALPDVFLQLDRVVFGDTPGVPTTVSLAAAVYSGSVVINASTNNYVLGGGGMISGNASLSKLGTGTLSVNATNNFTGAVVIGGGTLKTGNSAALGSAAGPTIVTNGGTLDVNGQSLGAEPVTVSGAGAGGAGAIVNSGGSQTAALRFVTLAGDATFGGSGRWDLRTDSPSTIPAALNGGGYTLTKTGANDVWLVGLGETSLGDINLKQGGLGIQTTTTMGDASHLITVASGCTLYFFNLSNTVSKVAYLTNATITSSSGVNVFAGPVTLYNTNTANLSASVELRGSVSGSGGLTKTSAGTLILSGTNTYAGDTVVSAGILRAGNSNAIPSGYGRGLLQVNSGTTLDMNNNNLTANAITGSGVIQCTNGARVLQVGGTGLSFEFSGRLNGSSASAYPTLRKTGGGTLIVDGAADNAFAAAIVDAGSLVLGKTSSSSVHALGATGDALVVNSGGTAQLSGSGDDQIADVRDVLLNGGTLDLNGRNEAINLLHGTGGSVINSGGLITNTLTVGSGNGSGSYSGVLRDGAGMLALTKTGTGTMTLIGTNSYSGATVVSNGWLIVHGQLSGPGLTTVGVGAGLAATGAISGPVRVSGTLNLGDPGVNAATTLSLGALTLDPGVPLTFHLSPVTNMGGAFNDLLNIAGDLVLNSNTISVSLLGTNLNPGVYRLINYAGRKTGSFGGVIRNVCNLVAIDESVTNQINLVVTAAPCNPIALLGGDAVLESVTPASECSAMYPEGTAYSGFTSASTNLVAPLANIAVQYQGWQSGGNTSNTLNGSYLIYRYRLDFEKPVTVQSIKLSGAAFNGTNTVFRLLDATTNPIAVWPTSGGNVYQSFAWQPPQVAGTTFFVDEYDASATWRYRDSIRIECASAAPITNLPRTLSLTAGQFVDLSIVATNFLALQYQWQFNGRSLANATNSYLLLPNLQAPQSGAYSVIVSNFFAGTATAAVANISIPAACATPRSGLVAWWAAEGNAADSAGANDGALQGAVAFTNGLVGQAFGFTGQSGAAVIVPDAPPLNLITGLTLEAWVKLNDTAKTYFIATKQPSGTAGNNYSGNYEFRVGTDGRLSLLHQTSSSTAYSTYTSINAITAGDWHHVAVTLAVGGSVGFYIDGLPAGSANQQGTFGMTTSEPLRIGTRKDGSSYFNGAIDELSLYNRALGASEIAALYDAWTQGKCISQLPPAILVPPTNQSVALGQNAAFNVTVRSYTPLSYQWQFDGSDLPGATSPSLTLPAVGLGSDGFYSVRVANSYGSVASAPARLSVDASSMLPFYFADFESAAGPEWSTTNRDVTPIGARHFLGQLGNQTVTLSLTNLPPHTNITVSFDLFILLSWDGSWNGNSDGPDRWRLQAAGGPVLLDATFNNVTRALNQPYYNAGQTFPGTFGSSVFPPYTGCAESNTLGYIYASTPCDSVYKLSYTLPQSGSSIQFQFISSQTEAVSNESWGLDNVAIYLDGQSSAGWPVVTTTPQSQTLLVGANANLSVTAAGAAPLAYQWLKNGVPLAGATASVLQIVRALTNDAGSYTVLVSNPLGSTVSDPAILALPPGPVTPADGPWGQESIVMINTPEAALMARAGDIDNMGFGWPANFDPFSGRSTPPHSFPWTPGPSDPAGTDRIEVPSSYNGHPPHGSDAYTLATSRPANLPQAIVLSYNVPELTSLVITSAVLQMFVDDFQPSVWGANFQATLNGVRAPFLETFINGLVQSGSIGKMITLQVPSDFFAAIHSGQLSLLIDDPTTGAGDGYAIDFFKLLINPGLLSDTATLSGLISDQQSGLPLPGATVSLAGGAGVLTDAAGTYNLANVPAGLSSVVVSRIGYQGRTQIVETIGGQTVATNFGLRVMAPALAGFKSGPSNTVFGVRLTGLSGLTPTVLYASTNLVNWQAIFTVPFVSGTYDFLDADAERYPRRFYRAGIVVSPTVPAPIIDLRRVTNSLTGSFTFGFDGLPNATYRVWASTNLLLWDPLGSASQAVPGMFTYTDTSVTNRSRRFYRISSP